MAVIIFILAIVCPVLFIIAMAQEGSEVYEALGKESCETCGVLSIYMFIFCMFMLIEFVVFG